MKYCHFIIEISLIFLFLLTGCIDPTSHITWEKPPPPIIKPVLKNMAKDEVLKEADIVEVEIGDSVSISINNFFEANYSTIEWFIDGEKQPNTDYVFVVKTDSSSPFYIDRDEPYLLIVKGAHIGGSETTFIRIKVKKPPVPKPELKTTPSMKAGNIVDVDMGESVTVEIVNYNDYSSWEWISEDNSTEGGTFYFVHTSTSPFNEVKVHELTFTGRNSQGDPNSTLIKINVKQPGVPDLELWNMTTGTPLASDTVPVIRGEFVTISVNNASSYKSFEWTCGGTSKSGPVYTVSTYDSLFNVVGQKQLTVKGTTILGFSSTTIIIIDVMKPPVPKPELKNMTEGTPLNAGVTVDVTMGSPVAISVDNVPAYSSFEWTSNGISLGSGPVYTVTTFDSPFDVVGQKPLTVKGITSLLYEESTEITINVIRPPVPEPVLKNMNKNEVVENGGTAMVDIGSNLTITINNYGTALYQDMKWYINNNVNPDPGTDGANAFSVSTDVAPFNTVGKYNLKVIVGKYGVTHEKTIEIEVRNPPEFRWVYKDIAPYIIEWIKDPNGNPNNEINNWTANASNTFGKAAWYKLYNNFGDFDNDREKIYDFMKFTNEGELWFKSGETARNGFQIYIRYEGNVEETEITAAQMYISNDVGTAILIYDFSLGSRLLKYEDED
jgi:hypothetical protein